MKLSRRRKPLPDKPTMKLPGQELVAWLPFENRHAKPGSVCALWLLLKATLSLHLCIMSSFTTDKNAYCIAQYLLQM